MKQGKKLLFYRLHQKTLMLACIQTLWMDFIQTCCDDTYYWTLHFDTSLTDIDLDSVSQECKKAKHSVPIISHSFQLILMEFGVLLRVVDVMNLILIFISSIQYSRERTIWYSKKKKPKTNPPKNKKPLRSICGRFAWNSACLPQPVGLLKLMLYYFVQVVLGRELCWCDFIKYTVNIVLCGDTCERICFKFGQMLDMTQLYSLIAVWTALIFSQGHRFTGKLELVQSFCCVKELKCSWWLIM